MMVDRVRMSAYSEALRAAVKPGSTVLDLGAGTGIFAVLACQFGARKVYAVEPSDVIAVAREIAAANGYANQIEFFQDYSTRINLADRADVIISDLRGVLPLFQKNIASVIDARARLLAPSGTLIPLRDDLWISVVEASGSWKGLVSFWEDNGFALDLSPARRYVVNSWRKVVHKPEQLLVDPLCWATIDYTSIESPDVHGEVNWRIGRQGSAHGLAVWFDTQLSQAISFSNAPGKPEVIYGQAFFPFESSVMLEVGDSMSVILDAHVVGEDYVWRWNTVVQDSGGKEKANFRQSSFFSTPLVPSQLRKRSSNYVPALNEDGRIDGFILSMMNNENSLAEIARKTTEHFPDRFGSWQSALNHIADLATKYG